MYERKQVAVIMLSFSKDVRLATLGQAKGVEGSWSERPSALRLYRSQGALSHDMAVGFVFIHHNKEDQKACAFSVVVYFPHKSSVGTKLGGVAIYKKPGEWTLDIWVE